jgi:hypothetical protein
MTHTRSRSHVPSSERAAMTLSYATWPSGSRGGGCTRHTSIHCGGRTRLTSHPHSARYTIHNPRCAICNRRSTLQEHDTRYTRHDTRYTRHREQNGGRHLSQSRRQYTKKCNIFFRVPAAASVSRQKRRLRSSERQKDRQRARLRNIQTDTQRQDRQTERNRRARTLCGVPPLRHKNMAESEWASWWARSTLARTQEGRPTDAPSPPIKPPPGMMNTLLPANTAA